VKLFQVDAFTNQPFKGNPAAVCFPPRILSDRLLQSIASEMNLSETAFVIRDGKEYNLRWFTPKVEVDLCGHATLAAAHILYEKEFVSNNDEIIFNTKSGKLTIKKSNDKIEMTFPQLFVTPSPCPEYILKAFDIKPTLSYSDRRRFLLEIDDSNQLRELQPDFSLLAKSKYAFMITARSCTKEYDFESRMFAPVVGINEDPVTGSAHCYLAPYWGKKMNKKKMKAFQASERSGIIDCELLDDNKVLLQGNAVTVFEGELIL
jgi:PhzF family phenazine biosynthesis protein